MLNLWDRTCETSLKTNLKDAGMRWQYKHQHVCNMSDMENSTIAFQSHIHWLLSNRRQCGLRVRVRLWLTLGLCLGFRLNKDWNTWHPVITLPVGVMSVSGIRGPSAAACLRPSLPWWLFWQFNYRLVMRLRQLFTHYWMLFHLCCSESKPTSTVIGFLIHMVLSLLDPIQNPGKQICRK